VDCPASILRRIPHAHLYLDKDSFGGSGHPSRGAGEQGSGGAGEQ
jgi:hypothetical protein